jgi:hypothetical protein
LKTIASIESLIADLLIFIGDKTVAITTLSKLVIAGLLLGAGAAQAAQPTSVSEVPASWYANRIQTPASAQGAVEPVFPTAAYEHGPNGLQYAERVRTRPSVAGSTLPFPASPNETGRVL